MARIYCHNPKDIPEGPHFAIIEFKEIHIPGDERSRTHPGHGYPASTESVHVYEAYTSRTEWEKEVSDRTKAALPGRPKFVAIEANRVKVELKVDVIVG